MNRTSVSVLVTVFNRAHLLRETIRSVLESRFCDFDVILVDDASSDDSWSVMNDLANEDPRLAIHRNQTNLGDYPNRRRAIELSSGELIKFLDADDLIYPHSLGLMVEAMERFPEAALALSHSAPELELPYPILLSPKEAYSRQFLGRGCLARGEGADGWV